MDKVFVILILILCIVFVTRYFMKSLSGSGNSCCSGNCSCSAADPKRKNSCSVHSCGFENLCSVEDNTEVDKSGCEGNRSSEKPTAKIDEENKG